MDVSERSTCQVYYSTSSRQQRGTSGMIALCMHCTLRGDLRAWTYLTTCQRCPVIEWATRCTLDDSCHSPAAYVLVRSITRCLFGATSSSLIRREAACLGVRVGIDDLQRDTNFWQPELAPPRNFLNAGYGNRNRNARGRRSRSLSLATRGQTLDLALELDFAHEHESREADSLDMHARPLTKVGGRSTFHDDWSIMGLATLLRIEGAEHSCAGSIALSDLPRPYAHLVDYRVQRSCEPAAG